MKGSDKSQLRAEILADFATISAEDRARWSEQIGERLAARPELSGEPRAVMAFLSMPDELDTAPLLRRLLDAGHRVYCPKTLRRSRRLVPRRLPSLEAVSTGAYGIREPAGDETVDAEALDLVVVPAVAFDRAGFRLGRGGGYYDRFLDRLTPEALTWGVIFSRHLLEEVPKEAHDRSVQQIVTEVGVAEAALTPRGSSR